MRLFPRLVVAVLAAAAAISPLVAGERSVELRIGGLTALADLVTPDSGSIKSGVVLITHGTLAHKDMELIEVLQRALAERGIASLAHTLTLGIDRRTGMYDCSVPHTHAHEDAIDEIDAWANWLKKQGAGALTLLGHSRGGNQVAWFAAERTGVDAERIILLAPAMGRSADGAAKVYRERFKADLDQILEKAHKLAASGKGKEIMSLPGLLYCPDAKVQAKSVLSYYGEEPRRDTPPLLPKIQVPTLVIAASKDTVVPDIAERVKPLVDGRKVRLEVIEGAGHMFLDFYADDAADLIAGFMNKES